MNELTKALGTKIKYLRKRNNLSQEQLAELCNLHPTYIGQLERGEKNASIGSIYKISKSLNISLSDLFLNIDNVEETNFISKEIYSVSITQSEEQQKRILNVIKAMTE